MKITPSDRKFIAIALRLYAEHSQGENEQTRARKLAKKMEQSLEQIERNVVPSGPRCLSCGIQLGKPGGYGGTGLCGPCSTGEADTLQERYDTW